MRRNSTGWYRAGETVAVPKPKTLNDWLMLGQSAAASGRQYTVAVFDEARDFGPEDLKMFARAKEFRRLFVKTHSGATPHSPPDIDPLGR